MGIDEGQFFDAGLVQVVNTLADRGVRVIVAGLDQDYTGRPFEPMPQILAVAEYVDKTLAICMQCGAPANRTQRLTAATDRVVVGGARGVRGAVPALLPARRGAFRKVTHGRPLWPASHRSPRATMISFNDLRPTRPRHGDCSLLVRAS